MAASIRTPRRLSATDHKRGRKPRVGPDPCRPGPSGSARAAAPSACLASCLYYAPGFPIHVQQSMPPWHERESLWLACTRMTQHAWESNPRYAPLFEPRQDRPGHRAEPVLSGATLHGHGPCPAAHACRDARHEGGGRLGRRVHRVLLDPSDLGRSALSVRLAVGRRRSRQSRGDGRRGACPRRARRHRALARRQLCREPRHAAGRRSACARCPRGRIPCSRSAWTSATSARLAAMASSPRRSAPRPRASTSSTSIRPTATWCRSSCHAASTAAPTNTAARSRTASRLYPRVARGDAGAGRRSLRGRGALCRRTATARSI